MNNEAITEIYNILLEAFGPQHWWPGDSPFEIAVGAILTQNTNWTNVEKAIANLKKADALSPQRLHTLSQDNIAVLIKSAGYFNIKAKRLKNFINWLFDNYNGSLDDLENVSTSTLREQLLAVKGIGPETADSILLYALKRPTFVVDAYTARIMARHQLALIPVVYEELKYLFESNLEENVDIFNEYHALLVQLGKNFCRPRPLCQSCPLNHLPHTLESMEG